MRERAHADATDEERIRKKTIWRGLKCCCDMGRKARDGDGQGQGRGLKRSQSLTPNLPPSRSIFMLLSLSPIKTGAGLGLPPFSPFPPPRVALGSNSCCIQAKLPEPVPVAQSLGTAAGREEWDRSGTKPSPSLSLIPQTQKTMGAFSPFGGPLG